MPPTVIENPILNSPFATPSRRFTFGTDDLLNLIVEVSGAARADKAANVATARNLCGPAVNNLGGCHHWANVEVSDPWDDGHTIQANITGTAVVTA